MKRPLIAVALLLLGAAGVLRGRDAGNEFYMKVVRVDRGKGELELELSTPPKKTKVLFSGEVGKVSDGDYLKFPARSKVWVFGGKEMKIEKVTWIF